MNSNKIGLFIKTKRIKKKMTQQELGEKLFVTDKAVSKWERGLSLPDITIFEKLADILDTDIYTLLQIDAKKDLDVSKILKEEQIKLKKQFQIKMLILSSIFVIIVLIGLFKYLPFGYFVDHVRYKKADKLINLGSPKFSFYRKNKENNFSYKNFRSKTILVNETKEFLNTLEKISCNDTIYYYDSTSDTTIIDYSVDGNIIYNTISYNVRNGNYCNYMQIKEYNKKLGSLNSFRTLYTEKSNLKIQFLPNIKIEDNNNTLTASMFIYYFGEDKNSIVLERSTGTFKIEDDELIYYRDEITEKKDDLIIPNISKFVIKNTKLILKDNYLKDYEKSIILK